MSEKMRVLVLNPDQYTKLEQQATAVCKVVPATELEAGFSLGVQHVLKLVRTGYAIDA